MDKNKDKLIKWILSSGPEDKNQVEAAINIIYQLLGKSNPKIEWADSPIEALVKLVNIKLDNYTQRVKQGVQHKNIALIPSNALHNAYCKSMQEIYRVLGKTIKSTYDDVGRDFYYQVTEESLERTRKAGLFFNPYYIRREFGSIHLRDKHVIHNIALDEDLVNKLKKYPEYNNLFNAYMRLDGMFIWTLPNMCIISDRPKAVYYDIAYRLHNPDGPAVEFADGFKLYMVNGVRVSEKIIEKPESITFREIVGQHNLEIQRLMIEKMGREAFIKNMKLQEIDESKYGILYRSKYTRIAWMPLEEIQEEFRTSSDDIDPNVLPEWQRRRSAKFNLHFVEVTNRSPEPNGEFKKYFIQVSPNCKTAKGAVAWTFHLKEEEYNPIEET